MNFYDAIQNYDLIVRSGNGEGDMQVQPDKETTAGRFGEPVSSIELQQLKKSRFPMKTVNNATCAVSVFGQWRASRNWRRIEGDETCDVCMNVPFCSMTDAQLVYSLPLFIAEV